jgi:hypothetical protein
MNIHLLPGILMLVFASLSAYAANGSGAHGGDAIVCEAANGTRTVEVLDYFESSQTLGLTPSLGTSRSYIERAKFALSRLRGLDLTAYTQYVKWVDQFDSEMQLADRSRIKNIDDSTELIKPNGKCVRNYKIQFAVQLASPRDFDKRYIIDKALWEGADLTQKAGLVLHEIFYREAINGTPVPKTSNGVRYFNAVVSSSAGNGLSLETYENLLAQSGLLKSTIVSHTALIDGFRYYYGTITYFSNGAVKSGSLYGSQKGLLKSNPSFGFKDIVVFNENGTLLSGSPADPVNINGYNSTFERLTYDSSEVLTYAHSNGNAKVNIRPNGFSSNTPVLVNVTGVAFYSTGEIKEVVPYGDVPILLAAQTEPIGEASVSNVPLEFYESGFIKEVSVYSYSCRQNTSTFCLLNIPYESKPGVEQKTKIQSMDGVTLVMDSSGRLRKMGPWIQNVTLRVGETTTVFSGVITFHSNGVLRQAEISEKAKFLCADGKTWKTVKVPSYSRVTVSFGQNGLLNCK